MQSSASDIMSPSAFSSLSRSELQTLQASPLFPSYFFSPPMNKIGLSFCHGITKATFRDLGSESRRNARVNSYDWDSEGFGLCSAHRLSNLFRVDGHIATCKLSWLLSIFANFNFNMYGTINCFAYSHNDNHSCVTLDKYPRNIAVGYFCPLTLMTNSHWRRRT